MQRMTVKEVEKLQPKQKPYKCTVDIGLLMRVAVNGNKSWIVQYCVGRKQKEYPLARPWGPTTDDAHLSLADARIEAVRIRALARDGIDYKQKLIEDRLAAEAAVALKSVAEQARLTALRTENLTVSDMFDTWLADGVRRADGNAELRRAFNADVIPEIGAMRVRDVTEHDIRRLLRTVVTRGANRMAVMLRDSLTQMFAWAGKRQPWRKLLAEGDPMELIEIEKIVSPDYDFDNVRSRKLSITEIRELHNALICMDSEYLAATNKRRHTQPVEATTQAAIWIMLSTLCRVGELTMAKWEHVDLVAAKWTIPKENVKGKVASLTVHLSAFAVGQFEKLKKVTGHTDYCFPNRDGASHIGLKAISKQVGDRQCMFKSRATEGPGKPLKHRHQSNALVLSDGANGAWTPHDLRRTGATLMQRLRVDDNVIDRCQNHVIDGGKVRRHYQQHEYEEEKKKAWNKLGQLLTSALYTKDNLVVGNFKRVA